MMKQANEEVEARAKVDPKSVIIDMVESEEEEEEIEEFVEDSDEEVEEREDVPEKKVIQMVCNFWWVAILKERGEQIYLPFLTLVCSIPELDVSSR
jgi:hypothetical protein